MTVETNPNYPSDLDSTIPAADDMKAEGDDHIRGIKRVIKTTLPNVTGAITPTHTVLNYMLGVTSGVQAQLNTLSSTSLATALPAQLGNGGKFIKTDGTTATWSALPTNGTVQTFAYVGVAGTFARAASANGTYAQTASTTVTVTMANTFVAGDRIYADFTTGTATDTWSTVVTATGSSFTFIGTASLTTSGNVTIYPPIVVTSAAHGLATSGTAYVAFSGTYTSGSNTVFQATTNTFQVQPTSATTAIGSGTVALNSLAKTFTYTKPAGLIWARISVLGGGGQGCISTSAGGAQPGSAGGFAVKVLTAASIGSTETVTLGIGGCTTPAGTAAASGQNGGTSSFGASVSATGGLGGVSGSAANNTATGVGGDINLLGNNAGNASPSTGGYGANSQYGVGGLSFGDGTSAFNARGYGAGGGSAFSSVAAQAIAGFGTGGFVLVEEFY